MYILLLLPFLRNPHMICVFFFLFIWFLALFYLLLFKIVVSFTCSAFYCARIAFTSFHFVLQVLAKINNHGIWNTRVLNCLFKFAIYTSKLKNVHFVSSVDFVTIIFFFFLFCFIVLVYYYQNVIVLEFQEKKN